MNLVWHIVRKDFRRFRLPWLLWLGLLVMSVFLASGLSDYYRELEAGASPGNYRTFGSFKTFESGVFLVLVQMLLGYALAALMVIEDSLPGTQAFWLTRPISGSRLLAAKALGALLVFGVLPALVLTPIWLGLGFAAGDWMAAASETLLVQGGITVLVFSLASISASANQFILLSVALAMATAILSALAPDAHGNDSAFPGLVDSQLWVIGYLVVTVPPLVLIHQFLTRRTAVSLLIMIGGLILVPVVGLVWPWDFVTARWQAAVETTRDVAPTVQFQCLGRREGTDTGGQLHCRVEGVVVGVSEGTVVRVDSVIGEWSKNGQRVVQARFLPADGHERAPATWVVRRLVGDRTEPERPVKWAVAARLEKDMAASLAGSNAVLRLKISATVLRGQVLGDLPVQVGEGLRVGANFTRVARLIVRRENQDRWQVNLQEWDALPGRLNGVHHPDVPLVRFGRVSVADNEQVIDRYVRRAQTGIGAQVASPRPSSMGRIGGIVNRRFTLDFPPPAPGDDGSGGATDGESGPMMLTKVRFVAEAGFTRALEVPVAATALP